MCSPRRWVSIRSNCGCAISPKTILKKAFAGELGGAGQFSSDQIPLHHLVFTRQLSMKPLRAINNWQCHCALPAFLVAKQRLVVRWGDADWTVDSWYYDDSDDSVDGDGVLPPCGEAEQDAVVDERSGNVDETYDEEHSIEYDDDGALGCSALPAPALAPVLALTGLAGLVRRRER